MTQSRENMPPISQVPWETPAQVGPAEQVGDQQPLITEMPAHLRPHTGVTPVETSQPIITEVPASVAATHRGNLQPVPDVIDSIPKDVLPVAPVSPNTPAPEVVTATPWSAPSTGEQPGVVHFGGQPVPVERRPEPTPEPFDPKTGYYGGYAGNTPVQDAQRRAAAAQHGMIAAAGEQPNPQQ